MKIRYIGPDRKTRINGRPCRNGEEFDLPAEDCEQLLKRSQNDGSPMFLDAETESAPEMAQEEE